MPFGLCNAPATFVRLMERVLKGLHGKACLVYLDDIIVMDRTFDEHLKNLGENCALFQRQVKYMGHLVTADGISTDEAKLRAVKDWPRPQSFHELCLR